MKTLPFCLGLARASEQALAKSFGAMALKHESDYEVHESCKLFRQWSEARLETLADFSNRHGTFINPDPARLRRALFHGPRIGGFGLLRDLQDLLLLVHQARTAWTALIQAAKEMKEPEVAAKALACAGELDRELDWLCTHIKVAAPQALTVPVDLSAELTDSPALALKLLFATALATGVGLALRRLRIRVA